MLNTQTLSYSNGLALFTNCGFWPVLKKTRVRESERYREGEREMKVSGGIASHAPLGRSHCPGQEALAANRCRMTRLYMHFSID